MADVKPYTIAVPDREILRLKSKLADAVLPEAVDFSDDAEFGAPLTDIKRLVEYWRDGFDWRAQEAKLNQLLPQFTTSIEVDGFDEFDIHFVHQRSKPGSIPLLFCHGWPGSFIEVMKILPLLTANNNNGGPTFHVVAPSLPNFGFSDAINKKGFGLSKYAEALHKLMLKLGYDKYVTQGGDWGFMITRSIATQFPDHCLASHVNCLGAKPGLLDIGWFVCKKILGMLSIAEKSNYDRSKWYLTKGSGYMTIQSTKPASLGFAFADSPVGQLAWIYEKLKEWTDDYLWTDDEILTWVSIYVFSKAGPAANVRIYYEIIGKTPKEMRATFSYIPRVPLGLSHYPKELMPIPLSWGRQLGPVVFQAQHSQGGHFAAYECPELFVEDLRLMFGGKGGAVEAANYFKGK